MLDTATVARSLSRTLGGEWKEKHKCEHDDRAYEEWFVWSDGSREIADPRESTDVCLEMLDKAGYDLKSLNGLWLVKRFGENHTAPTCGTGFRKAVIHLCAGEG